MGTPYPSWRSPASCDFARLVFSPRTLACATVDYVLFLQQDVPFSAVPNEVQDTKWVSKEDLKVFLATAEEKGLKITPWFNLICTGFLFPWWDKLDNLDDSAQGTIQRM